MPLHRLLAAFLGIAVVIGVIGAGVGLPLAAATSRGVDTGLTAFSELPSELGTVNLPQTSVMQAADGTLLAQFYDQDRTAVTLDRVAAKMQNAIIAIEDERFYDHGALDLQGLFRAIAVNVGGSSTQGASTLTQQLVKNVILQQALAEGDKAGEKAATEQTAGRKLRELRYAMAVEQRLSKKQILEGYLNIAYFGRQSYGVQAAAQRYFNVDASKLSAPQAAMLAGIVKNPAAFDPTRHPKAAKARRDLVLKSMLRTDAITAAEYSSGIKTPVKITGKARPNGCASAGANGFFCQYVLSAVVKDDAYSALGKTPDERRRALLTGGLRIRTTLDLKAQKAAVEAVNARVPPDNRNGLATSAVTVEPGTGSVVVMAQNRTYDTTGKPGTTSVNYGVDADRGGSQGFQTGSAFKPFTLASWLASGRSLGESVNGTPRSFGFSEFTACGQRLGGNSYTPGNSEGHEKGSMSVESATYNSVNVAYVEMESQLDMCDIAKVAESLGVHLAAPANVCDAKGEKSTKVPTCLPSLTLGVTNIAPLTMAAAYAGFADGGTFCKPMPVTRIIRVTGKELATYAPSCRQALDASVVSQVNQALRQVLTRGTASRVGPVAQQSAGKTGTTNGPYDTWFVGYTRQRSTAVWFGDPGKIVDGKYERRILRNVSTGAGSYGTVYGATIAGPIWKSVTQAAMQGQPSEPLP